MSSFSGISIIICTHNGTERLQPTLDALTQLQADFSWEIVIVNNASSDDTVHMVRRFFKTQSVKLNWKIIDEITPGLVNARLKGISEAKYDYVLFCDDDNWLFPDYLKIAAEILSENPLIGVLGGKGIPAFEKVKPDWFDQYSSSFAVGSQIGHMGVRSKNLGYLYGAGAIFKKVIVQEIANSGFQLALTGRKGNSLISGDDVELCYLAQLMGYDLYYSDRLVFYHWISDSRANWGYYVRLKEGITRSSALLFAYQYFYSHRKNRVFAFAVVLSRELIINVLTYLKNIINPSRDIVNKELSITILKARQLSFRQNFLRSITHFKQLKEHF